MKNHNMRILFVISVLLMASLACNFISNLSGEPADDPAPTQASQPGQSTAPTQASEAPAQPASPTQASGSSEPMPESGALDLSKPNLFKPETEINTYQIDFFISYSGVAANNSPVTGKINLSGDFSVNPEEYVMTGTTESSSNAQMNTEFQIFFKDNKVYMLAPETMGVRFCFAAESEEDTPADFLLREDTFLTGEAKRILPDETVDGRPVEVYQITQENLLDEDWAGGTFEFKDGRVYVDKATGFILRFWMEGRGPMEMLSSNPDLEGDIRYEMTIREVNKPVVVEPPTDCFEAPSLGPTPETEGGEGASGEVPLLPGAFDVNTFAGTTTFSVNLSVEETTTQYKKLLTDSGYTLQMDFSSGEMVSLMYQKGDQSILVAISPGIQSGVTMVIVGGQ